MLSNAEKDYILGLVKELTPQILKDINFTHTVKEVGHSFHGPFEDELVKRLIELDDNFVAPSSTRSMEDISYKGELINIKFGYEKKGQPNLCSFHRLFNMLNEDNLDAYYILSVDVSGEGDYGVDYYFFDVYNYLEYTNFNYGTGQLMLKETKLKDIYVYNEEVVISKKDRIVKLGELARQAYEDHLRIKEKQQQEIEKIVALYG